VRLEGGPRFTVICTDAEVDPLPLLAVIVYIVCEAGALGVPEIVPVAALKLRPAGNAGTTA
jgi:hypothetical protein